VYKEKIYYITALEGGGINFSITLEKKLTNEIFSITGREIKKVEYITKPTGYMFI
jgi:hypothetical protein